MSELKKPIVTIRYKTDFGTTPSSVVIFATDPLTTELLPELSASERIFMGWVHVNRDGHESSLSERMIISTDWLLPTGIPNEYYVYFTAKWKNSSRVNDTNDFDANTQDATATSSDILLDKTAYAKGVKLTGTCDFDSNTQDATASDSEILVGKTAYVKGVKKTGTMSNNGAVSGTINTKSGSYIVPKGYHNGLGKVQINSAEQEKLIPENIREGVDILGVTGTMVSKTYQDYQQLEYIESSGTQYIDTGFTPNQNTRVVLDFQYLQAFGRTVFGARTSATSNAFTLWASSDGYWHDNYGTKNTTCSIAADNKRHTLDKNKNITVLDGATINTNAAATFTCPGSMLMFALNEAGEMKYPAASKIWSCQIYDNGILVRDFVPSRYYNGEVGLYDLVEGKFYGNAGTGEFYAGSPTEMSLPSGYTKVDYIEATGTQYVDTECVLNQNSRVVLDVQVTDTATRHLFGARTAGATNSFFIPFITASSIRVDYATQQKSFSLSSPLNRTFIDFNKNVATINDTIQTFTAATFSTAVSAALFASNTNGTIVADTYKAKMKLFSCRIYDNGTLIRDFIPVLDNSNVACLYDKVNNQTYYNDGNGTFSYG